VNLIMPRPGVKKAERQRFVLYGVDWATYEKLIDAFAEFHVRMTYDRGTLELMSPQPIHEQYKHWFSLLFAMLSLELKFGVRGLGSTTFRREEAGRGFEPDECYYFAPTIAKVQDWGALTLDNVPIPDLILEAENTTTCLDRMPVFAGLGVPEVWRIDEEAVRAFRRVGDGYDESATSLNLPFLPLEDLPALLREGIALPTDGDIMEAQLAWFRTRVRPLYDAWRAGQPPPPSEPPSVAPERPTT
jgi:Uma2 family endonuclease